MKIIAHRGISDKNIKENTYLSILRGFISPYTDGVEFDVRLTRDNEVVVIHDKTIDRTSNGKGNVEGMSFKELKKYNFGTKEIPQQIPLLKEVLKIDTNKIFLIEIKTLNSKICNYVNELIKSTNKKILIQSFSRDILFEMKKVNPNIKVGILIGESNLEDLDLNLDFVSIKYLYINKVKLNNMVFAYTINDEEQLKHVLNKTVNIITDNPKIIYEKTINKGAGS